MEKEMTPRQVCELFLSLFNKYGTYNIEEVFKVAKETYTSLEEEF